MQPAHESDLEQLCYKIARFANPHVLEGTLPEIFPPGPSVGRFADSIGATLPQDQTFVWNQPNETQYWYGSLPLDQQDATGLAYRRNRYYDPVSGQFTQTDPIGIAGGLNTYGYAGGDPINFSDPFGLRPCDEEDDCPSFGEWLKGIIAMMEYGPLMNDPGMATVDQPASQSVWHRMRGETGNVKRLSPSGHHESVLGPDSREVTGPNRATFNFSPGANHFRDDVIRYLLFGTGYSDDDSTLGERLTGGLISTHNSMSGGSTCVNASVGLAPGISGFCR